MNKKITIKDLIEEFRYIKKSKLLGIEGVIKIDSCKPGPVLGITVGTHGNEIAGLSAIYYLRNIYNLSQKLLSGSVLVVINNIKATEKALKAKNEMDRLKSRYIDLNFNRLPKNLVKIKNDGCYEVRRARALLPIWRMFEVALDIHSTIQNNPPMIIASENIDYNIIRDFPVDIVITNIDKIQIGSPAFSFYGGDKKIQTIEIEAGQHNNVSSRIVAFRCIKSLLGKLGMIISTKEKLNEKIFKEYYVCGSVVFPDKQCELSRIFKDFEKVKKNEILAVVGGKEIKAKEDCCILMAPKGKKPIKCGEEAIFLSKPIKIKI